MALRPCKECGQKISTDAKVCPQCGKKQTRGAGIGCLVILGIFFLPAIVGLLFKSKQDSGPQQVVQPKPPAQPAKPPTAKETLEAAKKRLASGQPDQVADLVKPLLTDPKYGSHARELLKKSIFQMKDQVAADMQRSVFDSGEEVYVKAVGPNKETIEFTGPLIGPVWVHQFMRSGLPEKYRTIGFKRATFINDITFESWSRKLE